MKILAFNVGTGFIPVRESGSSTYKGEVIMQVGTIRNIKNFALWYFNKACNYDCEYCFGHRKREDKSVGRFSPEEIAKGFNDTGKSWWIGISGGEPFLYPKLTQIVEELIKKHFIHIDTNLSCNIEDFIEKVEPKRIMYLNCAFHVAEEVIKTMSNAQ